MAGYVIVKIKPHIEVTQTEVKGYYGGN